METIWNNVVHKKMYITGGVGARHEGEAFGGDYELPNTSAYCETCAAIGLALWNSRLLLLHGQARFADVLERSMYNNILAGVSMQGDTFFYTNPLASNGNHHRKPWYGTACCPTNIVRFIPSVGGYMYATSKDAIWVNLYIASTATIDTPHGAVSIEQQTNYPWSGRIELVIAPDTPRTFTLHLRHPGWCDQSTVKINGKPQPDVTITDGYVVLTRDWQPGDRVVFDMAMPVRRVAANPAVKADRGRVALQRGPIVYCLEAADNNGQAFNRIIPPDAKLHAKWRPDLLGGVVVVEADALAAASSNWENKLYQPVVAPNPTTITAVPYYAWDHREPGEMTVWIPESASSAGAPQ
jgi:DUF1680 family protein